MIKSFIYISILFLLVGCTHKRDFILFNGADLNRTTSFEENEYIPSEGEDENYTYTDYSKLSEFKDVTFEYKVVPNDRVSVIIYKHPELSPSTLGNITRDRGILINSKGDIRLPLVKSIHLAGLTQTEAQEAIENAFRRYLRSPDVYFEVLNKRAYVVGEVNSPGEIELVNEQLPLIQILAKAGDLKDTANRKAILILRSGENRVNSQIVDLTNFNSLKSANLMVKPNDIVYVLPNDMKIFNTRVNEINPLFKLINDALSPFVTIKSLY